MAAVEKDVAKFKSISKRHEKDHASVLKIGLPWEQLSVVIQKWGHEESQKCLRSLNDLASA